MDNMTYTEQHAVIPYGYAKGRTSKAVMHRIYPNGTETYACGQCGQEYPKYISVISHSAKHKDPKPYAKKPGRKPKVDPLAVAITDLLRANRVDHTDELRRLSAQVKHLKEENRALKRELAVYDRLKSLLSK